MSILPDYWNSVFPHLNSSVCFIIYKNNYYLKAKGIKQNNFKKKSKSFILNN
jgi:hypothetical protein